MKCGTKEDSIVTANGGKSEMRDERRLYCYRKWWKIRNAGRKKTLLLPQTMEKQKCGMNEAVIVPANDGRSQIREGNIP
ncbi:hypothetical protein QA612_06535 [Evansella sp. AB-P1]|uniref:hypothetical protein n=1 Tax=Evansella sp. AB-P1 TaxID=3037653 RepID=UPI00241E29FD|nr:hypothetical protein [Evansella sp. AB-P1]MDG5787143.1 hypothetical protein [Evansella sp. AB-P1]